MILLSLKHYRQKRDFTKTSEPQGESASSSQQFIYVIQKHDASHLHYDLRLELDGVLKSWAVPKGPSLNSDLKRLAVEVEDHPIDYATFEGNIPKGQYGAGPVIVWDKGTWQPEGNAKENLKKGKLVFIINGEKLKGKWALVRLKTDDYKNNWLLIKKKDHYATERFDIDNYPLSVISGASIEEIKNHKLALSLSDLKNAKKTVVPEFIQPQLAKLKTVVPDSPDWIHEIKFDGYRIICIIKKGIIQLMTRNQKNWTEKLAGLAETMKSIPIDESILDGEIVVFDESGKTDFQLLQNAIKAKKYNEIKYYLFDIPFCQKFDLSQVPLIMRKRLLKKLILQWKEKSGSILYSSHIKGNGKAILERACELGLEGIISKKIDAAYEQRRSSSWIKLKCKRQQEFVIGGYTKPRGEQLYFGALLLGYYQNKKLIYCGRVGTGFSSLSLKDIYEKLINREQKAPAFSELPTFGIKAGNHWVKPELVAEIEFAEWTKDKRLRQPVFKGLREDKEAKGVKLETVKKTTVKNKSNNIKLTNPEKILYPEEKITKRQLADFYSKIADRLLPHIVHRPLMLLRCPNGYNKECFFQKHPDQNGEEFVYSVEIEEKERKRYLTIHDEKGLLALVQMGVLEIHPWGSSDSHPEKPDRLIFDIDPHPAVSWKAVINCATDVFEVLKALGLRSFVKTSGGKGLHVYVPIQPQLGWEKLHEFAQKLAKLIVQVNPRLYTAELSKGKRLNKIFIDYIRNNRGATCVAPYSTRAKKHVPLSTPVSWDELSAVKSPTQFTIKNIFHRLEALNQDPWEEFFDIKQSITASMWKFFS
ncbi:DNA ligase D [Coxiella burnetii]|uniref:DNA ligase D n=1 Tax=Coxiella burnetii TaxID=777 RepID=UPI00222E0D68|nr:DNA ligase D [Coxiella burnetii]